MSDAYPNSGAAGAETRGPAERLLRLGEGLLAILVESGRTRIELLSVELAAERLRVMRMLAAAIICSVAILLGLAFASFLVVAVFWDTHRLAAIGAVTLVYALIAVATALWLRHALNTAPVPFANTRDTLERDYLALRDRLRRKQQDESAADSSSLRPGDFD